jgi:uncharacterized RDD family membrane protein YckC
VNPEDHPVPSEPDQFPERGPNSLAPVGARFGARVIDLLIVTVPSAMAILPFVDIDDLEKGILPGWAPLIVLVIAGLYEVALVAWRGQSVGKMAVGLRVARLSNGRNPDVGQAVIRFLLSWALLYIPVPGLSLFGPIAVLASTAMHPLRRGWHDRAAGTIVVRTR